MKSIKQPAIIKCREEEYSFFPSALWRMPMGWRPVPFPLRGPGSIGFLGTFIGIILFSRQPAPFCHSATKWQGADVIGVSTLLGDYGMGGYGFVGIRIRKNCLSRWLVFTLFGAIAWLNLNGRMPRESLSQEEIGYYARYSREEVPALENLVGSRFAELVLDQDSLCLAFDGQRTRHELVLRRDGRDVPAWPVGGKKRLLDHERLEDSLVICKSWRLWS